MDRHEAYRALAALLDDLRSRPFAELEARIGTVSRSRLVTESGEELLVDVAIDWHDREARRIALRASADSPSTFRMERLEERVFVEEGRRS